MMYTKGTAGETELKDNMPTLASRINGIKVDVVVVFVAHFKQRWKLADFNDTQNQNQKQGFNESKVFQINCIGEHFEQVNKVWKQNTPNSSTF